MVASISTNTVNIPQQSTNRKRDGRKSIYNGLFLLIMCITHQLLPASIRVSTKFTSNDCMSASDTKPKRKNLNDTPQYPKDRYCEPERGEWMGADKNSSRRRGMLQQDEHGFRHTSPTHYPRSHWSATEPMNQIPTSPTRERSGTPNLESTDQHRSDRWAPPVRPVPAGETWWLPQSGSTPVRPVQHTGLTSHSQKASKTPNRPTDLQTDPNSKQLQHRTTANTPLSEQKPNRACTGQTGERHRSDRVIWASRDEQHPRVNTSKSKPWSPESLHGLEQDFGDSRNTSWGVHSQD
jgi:hypothetical protein